MHRPFPQTPQAAEFAALAGVAPYLHGEAVLRPDCLGVVNAIGLPEWKQDSPARRYAGVLKEVRRHRSWRQGDVIWQKAHQSLNDLQGEELRLAKGNDLADKAAKEAARRCRPEVDAKLDEKARRLAKLAEATRRVAAAVLKTFPTDQRKAERVPEPPRQTKRRAG